MDFSLFHGHGGSSLCKFSPDGTLLATAAKFRLVVRNSESLEIVHIFSCLDNIQSIFIVGIKREEKRMKETKNEMKMNKEEEHYVRNSRVSLKKGRARRGEV
jgi:hypothetical protein